MTKHKEFEKRIHEWIQNERFIKQVQEKMHQEPDSFEQILERIEFNVMDAYRDIIQYPEPCPECTRTGNDHDGECSIGEPNMAKFGIDEKVLND